MKELTHAEAKDILLNGGCVEIFIKGHPYNGFIYKNILGKMHYWSVKFSKWKPSKLSLLNDLEWSFFEATNPSHKTENLTLQEARVALAEGFEVGFGNCCWIWNNLGLGFKLKGTWTYHYVEIIGPDNEQGSYFIIPHEPEPTTPTKVRLDYDQAVDAIQKGKQVNIQMPTRKNPTVLKPTSPDSQHQISVDGLMKLDFASRKGYEIWTEE